MPRYQFDPRAHIQQIDMDKADAAAFKEGASYIRQSYPMMPRQNGKSYWRGTNQPRTVSFTCADDEQAKAIAERYGEHDAFVWNIDAHRYV